MLGKSLLAYALVMDEDVFKALADPTRRRILDGLVERDGQTLFEICSRLLTGPGPALSRQALGCHPASKGSPSPRARMERQLGAEVNAG